MNEPYKPGDRIAVLHNAEADSPWMAPNGLWTVDITADLDQDGTHQIVVDSAAEPGDMFVVELTEQLTESGHNIWRLVNE